VVLFPLLANIWISFKPVTLGDLRAPNVLINERMMGDLEAVGDTADIRYRARNSSRKNPIFDISMTDTVPEVFTVTSVLTVVIIFEIWRYFPLAFLFILARMQSMSKDIYEAAEIDGATPLQQFWTISLPQLMGILAVLFLLRFIWTFNKFDDIFLLTGGAAGTRTLTVDVYEQAFAVSNLGAGAAVAVVVFVVLLLFAVIFFKFSPQDDG